MVPRTCSGAELLAVHLDVEQVAGEVVAGVGDVVVDLAGEVLGHRFEQRRAHLGRRSTRSSTTWTNSRNCPRPPAGTRASCAITPGGMNWAYSTPRVDDARVPRSIEMLAAQRANLRLERVDRARRERREQESARDLVKRRVRRDGRCPADRRGRRELGGTCSSSRPLSAREVFGVVRDRRHHLVGGGEPPAAVAIGVGYGAAFAQVLPDRDRGR